MDAWLEEKNRRVNNCCFVSQSVVVLGGNGWVDAALKGQKKEAEEKSQKACSGCGCDSIRDPVAGEWLR